MRTLKLGNLFSHYLCPKTGLNLFGAIALAFSTSAGAFTAVQTYYVPLEEADIQETLAVLAVPAPVVPGTVIETAISIAVGFDGTEIHYDHSEDDYEADIETPAQGSTEIWGDGDDTNGVAPGFPDDLLDAGDVVVLLNEVPTAPRGTDILYDAADKFAASAPVAVTRAGWETVIGTFLAGAVEVYPTSQWGTRFEAPVGEDMLLPNDQIFELVTAAYMAAEDGTTIIFDFDGVGGDNDLEVDLDEGESFYVNAASTVTLGSTATSNKPIQVHAITGDISANYESRWAIVFPSTSWSNEYFVPVSTRTGTPDLGDDNTDDRTDVFLYNPDRDDAIDVSWEINTGLQGDITVPAGGNARVTVPDGTGARFFTDSDTFYAIVTVDANADVPENGPDNDSDTNNRDYDWGFTSVPGGLLSSQALVGFAPSIDPTACATGSPFDCSPPLGDGTGSPVWVMSAKEAGAGTTTIFVDFDANPESGAFPDDGNGNRYDLTFDLLPLARAKVFDENDNDMTGALLYSADGSFIVTAWGQDPASSLRTNPHFDAGTVIPPLPSITIVKDVNEELVLPGAILSYTIIITNTSRAPVTEVVLTDELPPFTTYVPGSSELDDVEYTDGGVFPLAGPDGANLGSLAPGASFTFTFDVTVSEDVDVNVDEPGDCEDLQTRLLNVATVAAANFTASDDALTCVEFAPDIDIRKQAEGPDSRTFVSGSDVTFEIVVTNTGPVDLENVVVTDVLAPQCDNIIGALATEASVTYECTVPGVTASFDNVACVAGDFGQAAVEDCDPSTVEVIDIDIRKQAEGPDSRTFPSGSDVEFDIVVTNTGPEDLENVQVTDALAPQCIRNIGDLAAGASVTYSCTVPGVTEGFTNVAAVTGERNAVQVSDDDPSTVEIEVGGGQGCTPGYWKQRHHFDSWVGYSPGDKFSDVFGNNAFGNKTLLAVLKQGGGGLKALGRHTVAALLNSANPNVSYDTSDIIGQFNAVYPGSKSEYNALKDVFEGFNEQGCPLN